MNHKANGKANDTTRPLSIALLAVIVAASFGGACGSSSTPKPDAATDAGGGDHPASNQLAGKIEPGAAPPCITETLLLVGGQAQCTVVEHRTATGGVIDSSVPSCFSASQGPCWSLITSPSVCPGGGLTFSFDPDPANPNPNPSTISYDYSCAVAG